jgi:hypothetical protein
MTDIRKAEHLRRVPCLKEAGRICVHHILNSFFPPEGANAERSVLIHIPVPFGVVYLSPIAAEGFGATTEVTKSVELLSPFGNSRFL